jgi:hypothetical protein
MTETVKRGRGRPPVKMIDKEKVWDAVRKGLIDRDICEYLGISMSTWMRFKRQPGNEAAIIEARSRGAYQVWKDIAHACSNKNGKKLNIGAATMLLRRLEKGAVK